MATIYVGTVGQSVWRSGDGGESFQRIARGMGSELDIRALVVHPQDSTILYTGSNAGLYRTTDGGDTWTHLPSPMDGKEIWSLALGAGNANVLFAGTCPAMIYRSEDGGVTWEKGDAEIAYDCFGGALVTRITCILPHPTNPEIVYAGVEADNARRSTDGGRTWHRIDKGLTNPDIHDLKLLADGTFIAATNSDLFRSRNGGESWEPLEVKKHFPWSYCRGMSLDLKNPNVLYAGVGNGPPGDVGAVYRTRDAGDSWESVSLNAATNSTIWQFAANGDWMLATSISGQVFRSMDGGTHWGKSGREFGEIRGLAVVA